MRFADGNQVAGRDRRLRPQRRRRAAEDRPQGPDAAPAAARARAADLQVGAPVAAIGSPFGEEQSLSVGVISAARPRDRVADRASTISARSRPTRRSTTATPAARWSTRAGACSASTPRSAPTRRRRGRRLRGPGRHRPALARPAARATGARRLRLPRRVDARRSTRSSPSRFDLPVADGAHGSRRSSTAARPTRPACAPGDDEPPLPGAPCRAAAT